MSKDIVTVETINREIKNQLENKEVAQALLATTFKGLTFPQMAMALREGMIVGFTFKEFMQRDVYALPYSSKNGGSTYSLVSSIDYNRKIAMRTGLYAGKTPPTYDIEKITSVDTQTSQEITREVIISCTVTVKKILTNGTIGDFSAMVFFDEYNGKKNLWLSKPKTMIAKVAEMHALRMAFPEELDKVYIEEEFSKPATRMETVVDYADESVRMGNHKVHDQGKDETPHGEGVDTEPTEEEIVQIEEKTNSETK
jgi:phage recombination protein Bet